MATFPDYNPQYSATKRSQPIQRITQFGDGYQQRTTFGLNQDPKVWNLTFNVDDEDATEIETFLEARGKDGDEIKTIVEHKNILEGIYNG